MQDRFAFQCLNHANYFLEVNLSEKICSWTNAEGLLVYKTSWKIIDASAFDTFLGTVVLIGVYKSKNENVAQKTKLYTKPAGR